MHILDELLMKAVLKLNKFTLVQSGGNATQIQSLSLTYRQLVQSRRPSLCAVAEELDRYDMSPSAGTTTKVLEIFSCL